MNKLLIESLNGVTLLDRDDQPLITGEAKLYRTESSGEFFPQTGISATTLASLPQRGLKLKVPDGRVYMVKLDTLCQGKNKAPHFEFNYQQNDAHQQ